MGTRLETPTLIFEAEWHFDCLSACDQSASATYIPGLDHEACLMPSRAVRPLLYAMQHPERSVRRLQALPSYKNCLYFMYSI